MTWLIDLFTVHSAIQAVSVLACAIVLGLAIGAIQIRGVRLGVGGVLFGGILLGHFGMDSSHIMLDFAREFGLILFVFTIGMQVGPGFIDSLRRRGMPLNFMAACNVFLAMFVAVACFYFFDLSVPIVAGLFSGSVMNTPSLAASSSVFSEMLTIAEASKAIGEAGLGYAVAYPFGLTGVILMMIFIRVVFRIDPQQELRELEEQERSKNPPLHSMTLDVVNSNLFGHTLRELHAFQYKGAIVTRIMEPEPEDATDDTTGEGSARLASNEVHPAYPETVLRKGMKVHAVGTTETLKALQLLLGPPSDMNLESLSGLMISRNLLVTRSQVAGKNLQRLHLTPAHGISVARIIRAGMEFTPTDGLHAHLGDTFVCVGHAADLDRAEANLGNSTRALEQPHILPIFFGIVLGLIVGSIPVLVPGLPAEVKLGLAGGPLLIAILLSRVHTVFGMVLFLPTSANLVLREVGLALFLACVGLNTGGNFFAVLLTQDGLNLFFMGMLITSIPLLITALVGRIVFKWPFPALCGLLAGSMTNPPALAYATESLNSDSPATTYASVYPLTTILRILIGQILVLVLFAL